MSAFRGQIDSHGWWKPPVTKCCQQMYVYLDRAAGRYQKWQGHEKDELPLELRCNRCNAPTRTSLEAQAVEGGES